MLQSVDTQQFAIGIYRGSVRVGGIRFEIGIRATEGEVAYIASPSCAGRFAASSGSSACGVGRS